MQGTYKKDGLPRPYYLKPAHKLKFPYSKSKFPYLSHTKKKLLGYLVLLCLFGTFIHMTSQSMKPNPDVAIELEGNDVNQGAEQREKENVGMLRAPGNIQKDSENSNLANNLVYGSHGEIGYGMEQAPKGGIANEAPHASKPSKKVEKDPLLEKQIKHGLNEVGSSGFTADKKNTQGSKNLDIKNVNQGKDGKIREK